MNPATFLRALGPEPWNVAYPEPSIRPDDSRYGDNPNRVQRHTQFQASSLPSPLPQPATRNARMRLRTHDRSAKLIERRERRWRRPRS